MLLESYSIVSISFIAPYLNLDRKKKKFARKKNVKISFLLRLETAPWGDIICI